MHNRIALPYAFVGSLLLLALGVYCLYSIYQEWNDHDKDEDMKLRLPVLCFIGLTGFGLLLGRFGLGGGRLRLPIFSTLGLLVMLIVGFGALYTILQRAESDEATDSTGVAIITAIGFLLGSFLIYLGGTHIGFS